VRKAAFVLDFYHQVWAYYHHDDDAKGWLDLKGKGALLENRKGSVIGGGSVADRLKRNGVSANSSVVAGNSATSGSNANSARLPSEGSSDQPVETHSDQLVNSLTRILDPTATAAPSNESPNKQTVVASTEAIQREAKHRQGTDGLQQIVSEVHKALPNSTGAKNTGNWQNRFDRDHLIRIWKASNPALLKDEEERYVYRLLHKYNGSYAAYMELKMQAEKRRSNTTKLGAHVKWDVHGLNVNPDIDARAREILEELDRAIANKNFWMDSLVLHTNDQRFPTEVLRLQLEDALDAVLADQVRQTPPFLPFVLNEIRSDP
jgi:hypothetical protein